MSGFLDIPQRSNGQKVNYSWFNIIRTYLINFFGEGSISETQFTIANNTGPSDVTGLTFSGASYRAVFIEYSLYRKTDSNEVAQAGDIKLVYKTEAASWELADNGVGDAGVEFTMDDNDVQYASDDLVGANYLGYMRFRVKTISIES